MVNKSASQKTANINYVYDIAKEATTDGGHDFRETASNFFENIQACDGSENVCPDRGPTPSRSMSDVDLLVGDVKRKLAVRERPSSIGERYQLGLVDFHSGIVASAGNQTTGMQKDEYEVAQTSHRGESETRQAVVWNESEEEKKYRRLIYEKASEHDDTRTYLEEVYRRAAGWTSLFYERDIEAGYRAHVTYEGISLVIPMASLYTVKQSVRYCP